MEKVDPRITALVIIDPQNDFLSEEGVVWDLVGDLVVKNQVVDKLKVLIAKARAAGVAVVYSPHYYDKEYNAWPNVNFIDRVMFDRKMFNRGTWGAVWHPELKADEGTIVVCLRVITGGKGIITGGGVIKSSADRRREAAGDIRSASSDCGPRTAGPAVISPADRGI